MNEWQKTTIGEFTPFHYGKGLPKSRREPHGSVPVYGSNGIVGYHNKALTSGPAVIIGRKGTVGSVHYSPIPCWPIDTTFYVIDDNVSRLRFKYYLLKSLDFAHMNADSAVPGLNRNAVHSKIIYIPPLSEQRAIAHILGPLDDKIELLRRMSETLEAMARAIFKAWFVDFVPVRAKMEGRWKRGQSLPGLPAHLYDLFPDRLVPSELGEIPEGWRVGTLADLAELNPEKWSKNEHPDHVEYVDLSNVKWGKIEATAYYSWEEAPGRARRVLRPGDTIVGTVRPANGSYAFVMEKGLTGSTGFAVLRPRRKAFREFIYLAATSPASIEWLAGLADGAAYPAVRPDVVAAIQAVVPEGKVLERLSENVAPLLAQKARNERESRTLAALRDALLPKLIRGEIRVKDAEKFLEGKTK